jgi:hypothetical protein
MESTSLTLQAQYVLCSSRESRLRLKVYKKDGVVMGKAQEHVLNVVVPYYR